MTDLCKEVERFGKGIGNASRYRIIQAVVDKPKTVSEIVKAVKLSQPAVSQHLKTLKECNLLVDERRGKEVFYALNTKYTLDFLKNLVGEVKNKK